MDNQTLPRIAMATCDGAARYRLRITWQDGRKSVVDLASHIGRFKVYRPLRDGSLAFDMVRVGEYGADLVWTDQIDIAADTLWRLAQDQPDALLAPAAE